MEIIREGKIKSVHWEGTCIRCNAWVSWESSEIDFANLVEEPPTLVQADKFPYKLAEVRNVALKKDCPCCSLKNGITLERKIDKPGCPPT